MQSIVDIDDRERYTDEFWTKIETTDSDLLDFVLWFVETLQTDDQRAYFLDGLWIMYSLMQREDELKELETLRI